MIAERVKKYHKRETIYKHAIYNNAKPAVYNTATTSDNTYYA